MNDEIRRAMDARLSALEGSPERRARIRARIAETERKEEPVMKRKLTVAVALIAAMVLLGGTALAAGLGLNLFEFFGKTDKLWASLADRTVMETEVPVTIAHESLDAVEAAITNAYYDGEKLMVAYAIQGGNLWTLWAPTEEEIAGLEASERPELVANLEYLEERHVIELGEKVAQEEQAGNPVGYMIRQIYAGDAIANGAELDPYMSEEETLEDGTFYQIMCYRVPLPEAARNQDVLDLKIPLRQYVTYFWFDGSSWYGREEARTEVGPLTATVKRDEEAQFQHYKGSGEVNGVPITVEARISLAYGELIVTAENEIFLPAKNSENDWEINPWNVRITDENGGYLLPEELAAPEDTQQMVFQLMGSGKVPETLTVLLYEYNWFDDSANEAEAKADGVTITLMKE